jgi:nucleotide-binding universal stress UspA family protein
VSDDRPGLDIQRILHPTDFSDFSRRAFEHARALAVRHDAALTVLHVVADTMMPANEGAFLAAPLLDGEAPEAVRFELAALVAPARKAGLRVDTVVREGAPSAQIVALAGELPADMVVMGTHGRAGFQRWVLGSVAETVLRRVRCPVLTVPAHATAHPDPLVFERILCATDFSPASVAAMRYATALAEESGACLLLAHVLDPENLRGHAPRWAAGGGRRDHEATAHQMLDGPWRERPLTQVKVEEIVTWGAPAPEILKLARERSAGLIVMGGHGRTLVDLMAFGSVTHEVIREAACPVLTVRPPRAQSESWPAVGRAR